MYLIDTSYWIEVLRKNGNREKQKIFKDLLINSKVSWCEAIKIELWNGAKGKREQEILAEFEKEIKCFNINEQVWNTSLKLASFFRRRGLTIPAIDILIISTAIYYKVKLLHCDKHFDLMLKMIPK